jgi:hypothetical protein
MRRLIQNANDDHHELSSTSELGDTLSRMLVELFDTQRSCRTRWQDNHMSVIDEPSKQRRGSRRKSMLQYGRIRHGHVLKIGTDGIHDITSLSTTIEIWAIAKIVFLSCNSTYTARRVAESMMKLKQRSFPSWIGYIHNIRCFDGLRRCHQGCWGWIRRDRRFTVRRTVGVLTIWLSVLCIIQRNNKAGMIIDEQDHGDCYTVLADGH